MLEWFVAFFFFFPMQLRHKIQGFSEFTYGSMATATPHPGAEGVTLPSATRTQAALTWGRRQVGGHLLVAESPTCILQVQISSLNLVKLKWGQ